MTLADAAVDGPTLTNWAGNLTYSARAVHRPRSVEELADLVARAPRLRALGSRHCFNAIADSDELVVLDALPASVEVDTAARQVRVVGPLRYGEVAAALHAQGWALATMASLPHITVAGSTATATHGSGDGVQNLSAAVAGLELVDGTGERRTLTRADADLAGAVVHLGAIGVVTALTLDVEPTYDVAQEVATGLPWDLVLADYDAVTATADSVSLFTDWSGDAVGQLWRKRRVRADGTEDPRRAPAGAVPSTVALHPVPGGDPQSPTEQLGVAGPWHERLPHFRMEFTPSAGEEIQSEYLLPRAHAAEAMQRLRDLSPRITPLLHVSEVRTVAADDLWLSTAYRQDSVALHFTWQRRQEEVEGVLPAVEEALVPLGARPHWGKVFTAEVAGSPAALAAAYPRFDDARALFARYDPQGRFHNAWLERHGLV
ncbi:D-arabinono-1,4-lactone oxidase [Cellulomonas marina]|uniref:Xylitol oxidase n=1 Tax=Cellulomonas marina TaxID=988821 RepID=A0A1I0YDW4_9CELL|nr:D-arabinono-1,4-lactone oxidase [Cellulomonas marina]GIG29664.1 xylitol oxidase [Cellulomonas marina]SFB10987.1 xylitol oxidase [Cellulomonas marina]